MKLLFRRDQRSGMMGKVVFVLDVRAELTAEEKGYVEKYKMLDTLLYERMPNQPPPGSGALAASAHYLHNFTVSVRDLTGGKRIELKDIREMLGVEEQLKAAAGAFKAILDRAASFGGEELIEI